MLDAVHSVRTGFCPSMRMGKFAVPAALGIAKTVLKAVLATPAAERAAERTAPFQLSMGVSRGAEKLIHICRAAYENKWLVGKNDFANGFNSMSSQKMLDAHCNLFPEGTTVFNFFYGTDSPVFLFDADNDIITLQSSQGSRQGCAAGTHGFCFGLHPMLHELQLLFPEFSLRVLTDDVNRARASSSFWFLC